MNFSEFQEKYQKKTVEEFPNNVTPGPVISVLVQTYNHEKYIEACLEGIIKQKTAFPFEVIIGEDGSTDNTRKICMEFARNYPLQIRLILHNRENQIKILEEPSANFNSLYNLYLSKGEFIAFCEGDDIWTDMTKLQKQVTFLKENSSFSFSYHAFRTINSQGEFCLSQEEQFQPKHDISQEDLKKVSIHPLLLTTCFRKMKSEIPRQMAEVLNVDTFLYSLLGEMGKGKFIQDISPAYYRKHAGGIWSKRIIQKKYKSKILTYSRLREYYKDEENLNKYFKRRTRQITRMLFVYYFKQGQIFNSLNLLKKLFMV